MPGRVGRGHWVRRHQRFSFGGGGSVLGAGGFPQEYLEVPHQLPAVAYYLGQEIKERKCVTWEQAKEGGVTDVACGVVDLNQEGHGAGGGSSVHLGAHEDVERGSLRLQLLSKYHDEVLAVPVQVAREDGRQDRYVGHNGGHSLGGFGVGSKLLEHCKLFPSQGGKLAVLEDDLLRSSSYSRPASSLT